MQKVSVDSSLPEKLLDFSESVILCDAEGVVIGKFVPDTTRFIPPMSSEELQRRLQEPGGRTLSDILAGLEKSA